jgi:phosphodiesterase/alkaline phosphatase D-like protein
MAAGSAAPLMSACGGEEEQFAACAEGPPSDALTVRWAWAGARTPEGFRVVACLNSGECAELRVGSTPELLDAFTFGAAPPDGDNLVSFQASGLAPNSIYHWGVAIDGNLDTGRQGRLRTSPEPGEAASLVMLHGSCQRGVLDEEHPVWNVMREWDADVFLHHGDLHYRDPALDDEAIFIDSYHRVHSSENWASFIRQTPIAYVWDDHDSGGNNSNRASVAMPAGQRAYRRAVPHHPLPAGPGSEPIYHAFTEGVLRIMMLDTRSERWFGDDTILGPRQRQWLKDELLTAKNEGLVPVVVSSVAWIGLTDPAADDRGDGFWRVESERQDIADFIDRHGIRLVMLCGDVHAAMIDDGSNNAWGGFPVFHCAPLHQFASKSVSAAGVRLRAPAGGPYTHGPTTAGFDNPEQTSLHGVIRTSGPASDLLMEWEVHYTDFGGASKLVLAHSFRIRPGGYVTVDSPQTVPLRPPAPAIR